MNHVYKDSVQITQATELRKLRSVLEKVVEMVDADEAILDLLMGNITKDPNDASSGPKFSDSHKTILMNTMKSSRNSRSTAASIFMDEWITMAEKRTKKLPTVQNLLDVLVRCQLFRLADYIADISNQPRPPRPNAGPAKKIDISIPGEIEVLLDGVAYPFDSINSDNRNRSKPSPNSPQINLSRSTNQTNENNLSDLDTNPVRVSSLMSHTFRVDRSDVEPKTNLMEFSLSAADSNIPNISSLQLGRSYGQSNTIQGNTRSDVATKSNIAPLPISAPQQQANISNEDDDNFLPAVLNSSIAQQQNSDYIPAISFLHDGSSEAEKVSESHEDTRCSSSSSGDTDD